MNLRCVQRQFDFLASEGKPLHMNSGCHALSVDDTPQFADIYQRKKRHHYYSFLELLVSLSAGDRTMWQILTG